MSSTPNPYAPSPLAEPIPRKVKVRPIQLLQRAYEMIRGEYWLFLGITFVGVIIASFVPFGILLGPMMVGIFLCFSQRQQTGRTEFGTLMKGFDQFMDAFVATLLMIAASLAVMIPVLILYFVVLFGVISAAQPGPNQANAPPSPDAIVALLAMYPLMIVASMVIYVPFLFVFQLIADRKMTAVAAVTTSARASWNNLGGVVWFLIVMFFISFLAVLPCYIPAILLMPLSIGALWLLYQDIFGTGPSQSQPVMAEEI